MNVLMYTPRCRHVGGGLLSLILGAEERGNQNDGLPPSGVNEAKSL
jgi:hypothetical protein